MVPDKIKAIVPAGFREKRAAQFVGVGIHLFRRIVRDSRTVPRLLGKTQIYLRSDLKGFLRRLPVDHKAQLPVGRKGNLPVDREALKMRSQDPARLHRKEDSLGH